jgi:hypothetical protein
MQYINEKTRQVIKKDEVFDVSTLMDTVLKAIDERIRAHGIELQVTETLAGDMVIDVVKKKITRRRRGHGLLDKV